MDNEPKIPKVLLSQINWKDLYFYQKSDVLYQITFAFCDRFLPKYGDRTVDQMVQAARSGKQNIIEGLADGVTSTEMMMKLLNVGRASLQELQADYQDYPPAHGFVLWTKDHPRYDSLLKFCRTHNKLEDYQPFFEKWTAEEYCNVGFTLCKMCDKMMMTYLKGLETQFVTQGGIKERMYKARTGYRQEVDKELARLRQRVPYLEAEVKRLQALLTQHGIKY